jgi:peptidoglycan/xylan/chitin deacetylase (PgdA/CDA1 family)
MKHFRPVPLSDLIHKNPDGKHFHLSFDDGLRECAEVIAPLLIQMGIPASFFINTAFTDNKKLFHRYKASLILSHLKKNPHAEAEQFLLRENLNGEKILQAKIAQTPLLDTVANLIGLNFDEFLRQQQPYMSTEQIKKVASQGFTVGAHSHNHPEFAEISFEKQMAEVRTSMGQLGEIVKTEIRAFSFPFTDSGVSGKLLRAIHQEGLCDVTFGTAGIKYDSAGRHRQRYPVEQPGNFYENLKAEILYYMIRKPLGKATVNHPE